MKKIKKIKRLVVCLMCISALLSLFGCGKKDRIILDGPGMVNTLAWDSFSISRYGDSMADQNFHITVKYHVDGYILKGEVLGSEETEGMILSENDCRKIDELKPHLLPDVVKTENQSEMDDVMILDAPTVDIEVGYVDGTLHKKVDKDDFSMSIFNIAEPYFIKKFG